MDDPAAPAQGASLEAFRNLIRSEGERLYRDLPWRRTRDPYVVWLSEVMLQQTQVPRVESRMPAWLDRFPSLEALAEAPSSEVLAAWQGMGYNRRALALHRAAQTIVQEYFNMMMIVDMNRAEKSFGEIAEELTQLGEQIGVIIKCQSEEIFSQMHRI